MKPTNKQFETDRPSLFDESNMVRPIWGLEKKDSFGQNPKLIPLVSTSIKSHLNLINKACQIPISTI